MGRVAKLWPSEACWGPVASLDISNSLSWCWLLLGWIPGASFFFYQLCSFLPFGLRGLCFPCVLSLWFPHRVTAFLYGSSGLPRHLGTGAAGHFKCLGLELTSWWFHCTLQFKASHCPGPEWRVRLKRGMGSERLSSGERSQRQQTPGNSIGIVSISI